MATRKPKESEPIDLGRALIQAFLTNDSVNQTLVDLIDPDIWREFPPSSPRRNITTSFAHIHNVRCMRIKASSSDKKTPARELGSPISPEQQLVLWDWPRLWNLITN